MNNIQIDLPKSRLRPISMVMYTIGIVLATVLAAGAAWADYEASLFDVGTATQADENLEDFSCPVMITRGQKGTVHARLTNPGDRTRDYIIRAHVSEGFISLFNEQEQTASLDPGTTKSFSWNVTSEGAVWDRVVMVRWYVPRNFSVPPRTASCGILVLNVPLLPGSVIVTLIVVFSLISIIGGLALWVYTRPDDETKQNVVYALGALALTVITAMVLSLVGEFLLAGALLIISILLGVSVATWAMNLVTPSPWA
jgi:hypothetical protein